jgi:hypothetical protein
MDHAQIISLINKAKVDLDQYKEKINNFSLLQLLTELCSEDFAKKIDSLKTVGDIVIRVLDSNEELREIVSNFEGIKNDEDFLKYNRVKRNNLMSHIKLLLLGIKKLECLKEYQNTGEKTARNNYDQQSWNVEKARDIDNVQQSIKSYIEQIYTHIEDVKNSFLLKEANRAKEETDEVRKEIEQSKKKILEEKEKLMGEIKITLKEMKNTLSDSSIELSTSFFDEQAEKYNQKGKNILWAIGGLIILILTISYAFLCNNICFKVTNFCPLQIAFVDSAITEKSLVKFFIFSVLFSTLYQLFKTYNAYSHQYVINQHRALCLRTYKSHFASSGYAEETKDRILLKTADAIFDISDTGFVVSKDDKIKENMNFTVSPTIKTDGK